MSQAKYKAAGGGNGWAVVHRGGGIEYDLLESQREARAIAKVLNSGAGPEWDTIAKLVEQELAADPLEGKERES